MSNKLSVRRAVVRHPKICASAACPPPPPPLVWPPDTFLLEWRYTCLPMMGPCLGGADLTFTIQPTPWDWRAAGPPPEGIGGTWLINDVAHTASLQIDGWNDQWGTYWVEKWDIPVIWNTPTLYVISSWDMIDWWLTSAVATFTF